MPIKQTDDQPDSEKLHVFDPGILLSVSPWPWRRMVRNSPGTPKPVSATAIFWLLSLLFLGIIYTPVYGMKVPTPWLALTTPEYEETARMILWLVSKDEGEEKKKKTSIFVAALSESVG